MAIDGVNTAMTTWQFSRARAGSRAVETSAAASPHSHPHRGAGTFPVGLSHSSAPTPERTVVPPAFHWSYRPILINGRRAAKRTPQLTESAYLLSTMNHLA